MNADISIVCFMLQSSEDILIEHETGGDGSKPDFTPETFRAAIKIFQSVMLDKMWELQESEGMDLNDRMKMATSLGEDIRAMVKTYVNIDTHNLY